MEKSKKIIRHIPNFITSLNLFSGSIASLLAFEGYLTYAAAFIVLASVFDFFDGMSARLLKVSSPMGKELDSLSDLISFGFAPSVILYSLLKQALEKIDDAYWPLLVDDIEAFFRLRKDKS